SAAVPVEIIPGHRENNSGAARKPFAFPQESLFALAQESCSPSPRNDCRLHPGILFVLGRNPHIRLVSEIDSTSRSEDHPFLARSPAMLKVMKQIEVVGKKDITVLILGEPGTGKEVVARSLHAQSLRHSAPFVAINMGGLTDTLFESELFGHVRGAFTDARTDRAGRFELAQGGTLFLDEIGNLPLSHQAKLLRVLEDRQVERLGSSRSIRLDVRVIVATNADLLDMVEKKLFRQDLLFRLNTVEIHLPPLAGRTEDILLIAEYFREKFSRIHGRESLAFDEQALDSLVRNRWRGNVRELRNCIERAVIFAQGSHIRLGDVQPSTQPASVPGDPLDSGTLKEIEARAIRNSIERHGGNVTDAASSLGLSRSAMYRRMQALGIDSVRR
ncbi:MAG: sigma-54 interaction domain-containing protein, partial [Acidobacteriota bacterium]